LPPIVRRSIVCELEGLLATGICGSRQHVRTYSGALGTVLLSRLDEGHYVTRNMQATHILKALSRTASPRVSVYQNEKRVGELYSQRVGSISHFELAHETGAEFESTLLGFLGIKFAGSKVLTSEHELSTLQKAWLLEEVEREREGLRDPDDDGLVPGDLLAFAGDSRIVLPHEAVTHETSGFVSEVARVVETRRLSQAAVLGSVVVLASQTNRRWLASIASSQFVTDLGHLCSYSSGPYGLLGRVEHLQDPLLFVSPIWIWFCP
jgi:hypothetical protein